jgi:hypothetical protein
VISVGQTPGVSCRYPAESELVRVVVTEGPMEKAALFPEALVRLDCWCTVIFRFLVLLLVQFGLVVSLRDRGAVGFGVL